VLFDLGMLTFQTNA